MIYCWKAELKCSILVKKNTSKSDNFSLGYMHLKVRGDAGLPFLESVKFLPFTIKSILNQVQLRSRGIYLAFRELLRHS